jgi:hypothetical protein
VSRAPIVAAASRAPIVAVLCAAACSAVAVAQAPSSQTAPEAAAAHDVEAKASPKPTPAPFYRKYLVAGNPLDDQIVEQEKRIAETPNDASLHNDFGNLLARRRFPKEAAEQYEIAAKLDKSNFIAYYNLGLLRETEGKTSAAVSAYEKSIKRKPGFPPSRFRLGRLYEQEGRNDAAVEQYAESFRIDPSMRDPRRNPLVIDSELMYRASLTNYSRDVATAVETGDVVYADEGRFRAVPVDRSVAAEEVEAQEPAEAAPRDVGVAGPGTATPAEGARGRRPRPASAGDTGGGMVGGPQPHTTPGRPGRMNRSAPPLRPTPPPEPTPEIEQAPPPEPGQDPNNPETMPEPTPAPSDDVEPS